MRETLLLAMVVLLGTGGELFVTRAMKRVGEVKSFRPLAIFRVMVRAFRNAWMWLGVGMMTLAFFSLLALLTWENVSFVVPVTALSYAAGALGGKFLLGERVTAKRWLGVALVCLGVALVWMG